MSLRLYQALKPALIRSAVGKDIVGLDSVQDLPQSTFKEMTSNLQLQLKGFKAKMPMTTAIN